MCVFIELLQQANSNLPQPCVVLSVCLQAIANQPASTLYGVVPVCVVIELANTQINTTPEVAESLQ